MLLYWKCEGFFFPFPGSIENLNTGRKALRGWKISLRLETGTTAFQTRAETSCGSKTHRSKVKRLKLKFTILVFLITF